MRVIATAVGFYGGSRRRVGAQFDVKDGESASWFSPVAQSESTQRVVPAEKAERYRRANKKEAEASTGDLV